MNKITYYLLIIVWGILLGVFILNLNERKETKNTIIELKTDLEAIKIEEKSLIDELEAIKNEYFEGRKLDIILLEKEFLLKDTPLELATSAIIRASDEYQVPVGLIIGIANAESGLGRYYYKEYDRDHCFNAWGLRRVREDGSYLRCFDNWEAGARTVANILKKYYLGEGRVTPAEICEKWVGYRFNQTHCPDWINNVKKYYN